MMGWRQTLRRIALGLALTWGTLAGGGVAAHAQGYPSQLVRIVVPASAGSVADVLARAVADKLSAMWKQQVIVENRPGLAGSTSVARATPDGYTLMMMSNGHVISKSINPNTPFDPIDDFAGISHVASVPLALVTPYETPANTLGELIALAKASPGRLNFSSSGVATASYLAAEMVKQQAGIDIVHVPYKGANEAATAIIRNDAQLYFAAVPTAQEQAAAKKLKVIAVTTPEPLAQLPGIPPMAKAGLPDFRFDPWFGLMAPKKTPAPIIDKISRDVATVLAMPDVKQSMLLQGSIPVGTKPAEFDETMRTDAERFEVFLRKAGVRAN